MDAHIHSRFSRATSPNMNILGLTMWAKYKGIDLLGTGDFTHPFWLAELKEKLAEDGSGLLKLKNNAEKSALRYMLTAEISCIYSQDGKGRRIHLVLFSPSFSEVEKINAVLSKVGNLYSDGRPILGISAYDVTKIILEASKESFVVPAHIWTPWFSLFGSNSGFNTTAECFKDLTKEIFAMETGLSCYDEKTEVLTENGWKKFSEVQYSDKICTLNPKTSQIEFQYPTRIFRYSYKGKMYRLRTKRVDLLVTPNHKLFVSHCDFRKPANFFLKEAQFLFNKSKRFQKDGIWIGKNTDYFTLPAVKIKHGSQYYSGWRNKKEKQIPMKFWLKFFGFWIAEGWTSEGKNGDYNVCLSNRNEALLSEMKNILEGVGYKVYWDKKMSIVRVRDYQLFHYLKQFGKCSDKFIPSEVKSLSKEFLEIFLEYYIKGDGHIYGRNGKGLSATTTSIRLRDNLQEIALKIGISAYYKLDKKRGTPFRSPGQDYKKVYKQRENSWVVYFIRKNIHTILPSTIKKYKYVESWVDFKGPIFCVAVPNRVVYVRRNGIPVWCGNSDPGMNWRLSALDDFALISNSDAHSPANLGREATVFEVEKKEDLNFGLIKKMLKEANPNFRRLKSLSQVPHLSFTIEFFPEEGKYHYDGHRVCGINISPEETKKLEKKCPKCQRDLTIGVLHRVYDLADRKKGFEPERAIKYKNLVPLPEIIAESLGSNSKSKQVEAEYLKIVQTVSPEIPLLLDFPLDQLEGKIHAEIIKGIKKVREGKVEKIPGYDGIYGIIKLKEDKVEPQPKQSSLFT